MESHRNIVYIDGVKVLPLEDIFRWVLSTWTRDSDFVYAVSLINDTKTLLKIYRDLYEFGSHSYADLHKVKKIHQEFSKQNPEYAKKSYNYIIQFNEYFRTAVKE